MGRVDVALLDGGWALVSWLEQGEDSAAIRARRVSPSGELGPASVATTTSVSRSSGFPQLERHAGKTFLAWTEVGDPSRVRTGILPGS